MKTKNIKEKIIYKTIYCIIIVCICYHILYLISVGITKKDYLIIGNIGFFVEKENDMKGIINKNDIAVIKRNIKEINENDVILINKNNQNKISKIYKIEQNEIIQIKGENSFHPSNEILTKQDIEGKVIFKIPIIGFIIRFLQSKIMSVIVIILLILKFNINNEIRKRKSKSKIEN